MVADVVEDATVQDLNTGEALEQPPLHVGPTVAEHEGEWLERQHRHVGTRKTETAEGMRSIGDGLYNIAEALKISKVSGGGVHTRQMVGSIKALTNYGDSDAGIEQSHSVLECELRQRYGCGSHI
ncbi:hypothetical protein PI125_g17783 [Phytophthora idaei]|nr:hypothetical protein PI125_g17783 [Phytophthora idaei]KAG3142160.1 hypothetical protein PI126_g15164 [Phytophthora idaei]